jgi:hypothetical protein
MAQIRGQKADDNDNDPVEVRHYQILGGGLDDALGRFPTSPIWYRWQVGTGYLFWQYFPNGIIISTPQSCACVLYGPIYNYWDQTGQFDVPLGAPTTDVLRLPSAPSGPGTPPPPPGASYAVFEHGVLYLDPDINASVQELSPLASGLVTTAANVTPTGEGIAQAAQGTIQGFADTALATNQHLADNVEGISTAVSFNSIGPGGCAGTGFDAVGRSLLRSHILNVHFDFDLTGCAGVFGDAAANLRVEVRLFVNPPSVSARLVNFWIDSVSSPYSVGDHDIRDGLISALNGQFGRDLLNRTIPKGITVLAGIVETNGDVNLYIAPICAPKSLMMQLGGGPAISATTKLRKLRDSYLATQVGGRNLIEVVSLFGPAFTAALRDEKDGATLSRTIAQWLTRAFSDEADLDKVAEQIELVNRDLQALLTHPSLQHDREWPKRHIKLAVSYVREQLTEGKTFHDAMSDMRRVINEEIDHCRKHGEGKRTAD